MKSLGRLWAGRMFGTNIGNIFLELTDTDPKVVGTLRLMDTEFGAAVYSVEGTADDGLSLVGTPVKADDGVQLGELKAEASLTPEGNLRGTWSTTLGTGGTFQLFPHDPAALPQLPTANLPEQLYTKDVSLGAVRLFADDVKALLDHVREDFVAGRPVVTYNLRGGTVSKYCEEFLAEMPALERLEHLKVSIQEPEAHGVSRVVVIDLNAYGQNSINVQGVRESWVLGKAASLEALLRPNQRTLVTTYKKFGLGLNQVIFMAMLVLMPSLPSWQSRAVFAVAVLLLLTAMLYLHSKLIPNAQIRLGKSTPSIWKRFWPTAASWIAAIATSLIAALIFQWLTKGAQ